MVAISPPRPCPPQVTPAPPTISIILLNVSKMILDTMPAAETGQLALLDHGLEIPVSPVLTLFSFSHSNSGEFAAIKTRRNSTGLDARRGC